MERILLLVRADSDEEASATMEAALQTASARRLVTCRWEGTQEDPWQAFGRHWQGQAFVLLIGTGILFTYGWDRQLVSLVREAGKHTVLTGILPWEGSPVDAVQTIAAQALTGSRLSLTGGLTLRYAKVSHLSAFLNPFFVFSDAAFFRMVMAQSLPPELAAYENRWTVKALRLPVLRADRPTHIPDLDLAQALSVAPGTVSDYCGHFGIDLENGTLSPSVREGIFTRDLQVESAVPLGVKMQEAIRGSLLGRSGPDPLCVTACLEDEVDMQSLARFRRLRQIGDLKLVCYASQESLRTVLYSHPNTLTWKAHAAFPVQGDARDAESMRRYEVFNRFWVLAQGREKYLDHTHYIWMDFDYLRYPVYPGTALHWQGICTDRVTISRVGDHLDFSMIVVPDEMVSVLRREILAICEREKKLKGGLPEPEAVIRELAHLMPARFDFPDTPSDHELFSMTMTLAGEEWGTIR